MSSNNHNENDETSSTAYNNFNSIVPQALDAPLLDDYLSTLLLPKLSAVLSNNHDDKIRLSNEFQLALLQMVAILWTRGHTPSLQTLPLKLTKGRGQKSTTTTTSIILWYAVLSVALPTLYESAKKRWTAYVAQETLRERFEAAASSTTTTTTPKQDKRQLLMRQRRRLAISTLFRVVDTIVPMLRLGCLLSVWRTRTPTLNNSNNNNNIHLAPTLAMKLLGLHYVATTTTTTSSSSAPLLQVYYAHRRWLHDEVTRLLPLVLVPLQCAWSESTDYVQSWFRYVFIYYVYVVCEVCWFFLF